jgi:hypothetical protein
MHQLIACKQIHHKLRSIMESLNSWSRSKFGVVSKEIAKIKKGATETAGKPTK